MNKNATERSVAFFYFVAVGDGVLVGVGVFVGVAVLLPGVTV